MREVTSLISVNTALKDSYLVASHMQFLKNGQPFIHKLIQGYISSILCKINFGLPCPTSKWNILFKMFSAQSFHQKNSGTENLT